MKEGKTCVEEKKKKFRMKRGSTIILATQTGALFLMAKLMIPLHQTPVSNRHEGRVALDTLFQLFTSFNVE